LRFSTSVPDALPLARWVQPPSAAARHRTTNEEHPRSHRPAPRRRPGPCRERSFGSLPRPPSGQRDGFLHLGLQRLHLLTGLLRQSVFGRLAGYEDVNDAEQLSRDPAMRAIVDRKGLDRRAASTSQLAGTLRAMRCVTKERRRSKTGLENHHGQIGFGRNGRR
jgi:hypothetical protein